MDDNEIINLFLGSKIFTKWHYFNYHFSFYPKSIIHPFAESIVRIVTDVENILPGAGLDYIKKLESLNGKKDFAQHYDQLLQVLSEMLIVHKTLTFNWKNLLSFNYEPITGDSKKNPELVVNTEAILFGIEVKAPEFVKKHNERASKRYQLPARSGLIDAFRNDEVLLPRDNVVKDFLLSANSKFKNFKEQNSNFYGILVIVWDDFVYEPITALLNSQAGLLTDNSFALDDNGLPYKYENIDSVIITRHLLNIKCGSRDEQLPPNVEHALDYGRNEDYPYKIIIKNPFIDTEIPREVIDCFQVYENLDHLGSEYDSTDLIVWINN